ncbi:unnamed protein product [Coregonus sp. 'balchen']|nr:unnamed protein product [Coregonus sp. 'balchen']
MTQGTFCWFGGVWGLLLWCALFGPYTNGQRGPQRHPNCRYNYLAQSQQSSKDPWLPRIPRKYCDPSFNSQSAEAITRRCKEGYYGNAAQRTGCGCRECLIPEAKYLLMHIEDLLRQLSETNSSVPNINVAVEEMARMMKEVQRMVHVMRHLGCSNQTKEAAREQEKAPKLLDFIRNNMTAPLDDNQAVANETAVANESLMTWGSALSDLAEAVAQAEDLVNRTRSLNSNSTDFLRDPMVMSKTEV